MLKRFLALLTLLVFALPLTALAANGTLTTKVATQGGTLSVNGGPDQLYGLQKTVSVTDLTTTAIPVVVTASPGYTIATVIVNGVRNDFPDSPATFTMGSTSTKTAQSLLAYFTPAKYNVSVTAGPGGTAGPAGVYQLNFNAVKDFVFSPNSGNSVVDIEGLAGQTVVLTNYATGAAVTLPAAAGVKVKAHLTATSNVVLNGVFVTMTASAGTDKTVLFGDTVTLTATASEADATFAWLQISGPNLGGTPTTPLTGVGATLAVTAGDVATTYGFKVTATSTSLGATATSTVKVNVAATRVDAAMAQCQVCHAQNNIGTQAGVWDGWSATTHASNAHGPMCYNCHVGANTGAHPGTSPTSATCVGCHAGPYAPHNGTTQNCLTCHDPHSLAAVLAAPHVGGEVLVKAQYLADTTLPVNCASCHAGTSNAQIYGEFAESGHADPTGAAWWDYDWRGADRAACQRCHTGTGFAAKLGIETDATNIFQASDMGKPGEVLNCSACHSNVEDGTLRTAGAFTAAYSNGASSTFPDVDASNLCVRCHSARENGDSIKFKSGAFTNLSFINSHYLSAAGSVFGTSGYQFNKPGSLTIYPTYVPDETPPRGVTGGASGWGATSWQGPAAAAGAKSNWHVRLNGDGNYWNQLFGSTPVTVADLTEISWNTKKPATTPADQNWVLFVYTAPEVGDSGGKKTVWASGVVAQVSDGSWKTNLASAVVGGNYNYPSGIAGPASFATFKAEHGTEKVMMVSVQTMSNWNGCDAQVDGLSITLADGRVGKVDFAATTEGTAASTVGLHRKIGVANQSSTGNSGPCVACHMGVGTNNHTWDIANSNACVNCHSDMDAIKLEEEKANFLVAMDKFKDALAAKGITASTAYPYFYNAAGTALKDWTLGGTRNGRDVMGAAFNYGLLAHEPGAFAHNRSYALHLISDSIDFLNDGVINGGIANEIGVVTADPLLATATGEISASAAISNCMECHTSQTAEWETMRHFNENNNASFRGETSCTPCHYSGDLMVTLPDTTTLSPVVGCRACHGSDNHPEDNFASVAAAACFTCHNTEHHTNYGSVVGDKVAESKHGNFGHNTGACARCHTYEGSVAYAAYTGDKAAEVANAADLTSRAIEAVTATNGPTCAACHDPHTGGMRAVADWDPNDNGVADQFDICTSCHNYTNKDGLMVAGGSTTNPAIANGSVEFYHSTSWYRTIPTTHYDNPATGVGLTVNKIEGYVIRKDSANPCFDCHGHELKTNTRYADAPVAGDPEKETTIFTDWAKSGHAGGLLKIKLAAATVTYANSNEQTDAVMNAGVMDPPENPWAHYNWDQTTTRAACQHCHTATGAANFLDSANANVPYDTANNNFSHLSGWTSAAGSPQNELLYCWGCHSQAETGALRYTGAVTVDYTVNSLPVAINAGNSAACITCHSGRGNLDTLLGTATMDPTAAFISSPANKTHYMGSAQSIYQATLNLPYTFGLNYADVAYFEHNTLGCAECHMTSENSHTYEVVEKNDLGVVTAIASDKCVECHSGAHGAPFVAASMLGTEVTLAAGPTVVTQPMIDAAGAFIEEESEGFQQGLVEFNLQLAANGITMTSAYPYASGTIANQGVSGAIYNYKFLQMEAGAFAHNRVMAKRMVWDSIDWLDNGAIDNSVPTTVAGNTAAAAWLGSARP